MGDTDEGREMVYNDNVGMGCLTLLVGSAFVYALLGAAFVLA